MNRSKRLLLAVAAMSFWTSCASIGPPMPPSLELPKPPSDLRATRKGDHVTLTWTIPEHTTDRQNVRYLGNTNICRSLDPGFKQCGSAVGQASPPPELGQEKKLQKTRTTFVDALPRALQQLHAAGEVSYAVEVLNTASRSAGISNKVRVPLIPTLPPFAHFAARIQAEGILITWQCPLEPSNAQWANRYLFRISRRSSEGGTANKIAEVDGTTCASGASKTAAKPAPIELAETGRMVNSFIDQTFEWEKTYIYSGTVVSVAEAKGRAAYEIEGDDTPEVRVFAHDVFPPAVPSDLQAAFSGPGQKAFIDLIWAPVQDADLAGYNVYRNEKGGAAYKLNATLVESPAFRDEQVEGGRTYFYSVTAVDERGNESTKSPQASETVP